VISYFQAIVIGPIKGVTELFPISSLGHSVFVPAWLGWDKIVTAQSQGESFYLAFVVALHVATAIALLGYFRDDWIKIISGFLHTLRTRKLETADERMAWLLIIATIPAGITGLIFEHTLRTSPPNRSRRDLPHHQRRDQARRRMGTTTRHGP
jgi:undecaprenyl-diphosphatase